MNIECFQQFIVGNKVNVVFDSSESASSCFSSPQSALPPSKVHSVMCRRNYAVKQIKPSKFDESLHGIISTGTVQTKEEAAIQSEVDWVVDTLSEAQLANIVPGIDEVPNKHRQRILSNHLGETGKSGSLQNARRSLSLLNDWLLQNVGPDHRFRVKEAVLAWFFIDNPSSKTLRSGLVFAHDNYNLKELMIKSAKGLAIKKPVARGPAPSSTGRALVGYSRVAADKSLPTAPRYIAGVKVARTISSLRGIDSRRSTLTQIYPTHFVGTAFDRKGPRGTRRPFDWACIIDGLHEGWSDVLLENWKGMDSMCLLPSQHTGTSWLRCDSMSSEVASNTRYVQFFRVIAERFLDFSPEECLKIKSHGDRHCIPNFARLMSVCSNLNISPSDGAEFGRWSVKNKDMYLLYSSEVQFVKVMALLSRILEFIRIAFTKKPEREWPAFGGWDAFLDGASPDFIPCRDLTVFAESDNESEDSDDIDEQSDDDEGTPVSLPCIPADCTVSQRTRSNGKTYNIFVFDNGHRERSLIGAMSYSAKLAPSPPNAQPNSGGASSHSPDPPVFKSKKKSKKAALGKGKSVMIGPQSRGTVTLPLVASSAASTSTALSNPAPKPSSVLADIVEVCPHCPLPYGHRSLCQIDTKFRRITRQRSGD